ncbi:MAG: hypothetical protein FJ125_09795, partial [Deltaproteobacteria bacterium]|nr:hypothetical protein [Deltaproteobacteria bacterium]
MKFPPVLGKLHSAVPLWPFPLLSVALDLLLRTDPASSATRLLWYLGSMTWSLVTWQLLFGLSARICRWRPGLGRTVVVLFCALAALLTVVSLGFFMHFSAWPTSFALVHALGEPAESFGYIASGLAGPFGAAVVLLAIAYSWWWLRALRLPPPATRMTLFSLFLWLGFAVTAGAVNRHSSFMVPDASAQKTMIDALVNATLGGFHGRLLDAQRKPIPPAPPPLPYRPNIVFIVGESLSPQHMSLLGYGRDTTPELVALAGRDGAAGYASFAKAVSCGTATKVALPSLMTGLFPQRSPLEL